MKYLVPLTLSFAVAIGLGSCGKSEESAQEAAAPATGAAEEQKPDVATALEEASKQGREAAVEMAESVREKGGEIAETAKEQGAELAGAATAKAEELIATVKQYIEDHNIDLASEAMEQLRQMKNSLPESLQAKIDQLEQLLSGTESGVSPSQGQ